MNIQHSVEKSIRLSRLGRRLKDPVIAKLMADALSIPGLLSLAAGFTDNTVLPLDLVGEAVIKLADLAEDREHLQYGTNQGRPGLRQLVADELQPAVDSPLPQLHPDQVIISNGSQQILYISAQILCEPGDIVLVEAPSYFVYLEALHGMDIRPVSIPACENGRIDFPGLRRLLNEFTEEGLLERVKLVYFNGYFANPSSRCMHEDDKRNLGILLAGMDSVVAVLEDAAYRELYYDHPYPARTVLQLEEFSGIPCIYTGTFTKSFATGLKTGYAVSTDSVWKQKILQVKAHQDFGTSNFTQAIIEQVLTDGHYPEFLSVIRGHYSKKMTLLHQVLSETGLKEEGWSWEKPEGGLLLWLKAPEKFDTGIDGEFCRLCLKHKVLYVPGDLCFAEGNPKNCIRLSIGSLDDPLMIEAARRFSTAAREFAHKQKRI